MSHTALNGGLGSAQIDGKHLSDSSRSGLPLQRGQAGNYTGVVSALLVPMCDGPARVLGERERER